MTIPPRDRQRDGLLRSAIALCDRLSTTVSEHEKQQLSDRFLHLSQQLQQYHHPIQIQSHPPQEIPLKVRRSFVEAVALLPLFYQQVQPAQIRGTLASATLLRFRLDPLPEQWPQNLTELVTQFCLSDNDLTELQQKLERVKQRCDRHRRIMQALLMELLDELEPDALFLKLFGESPASALTYVATDMQLIFALADEDDPLLKRLTRFQFAQFENFPSFGPLEPSLVAPQLLTRLMEQTGFRADEIVRSLRQTIGLIPAAKADMFLVHDVYGHLWQLFLTDFCGDYRCLAQANRALKPGLAAYGDAGPLALREVLVWQQRGTHQATTIQIDEARARYFFRGEMQQRLGHLLTHLLAEILADVQEFKWGWRATTADLELGASAGAEEPAIATALPSSSLLPHWPAKLDLTLQDLKFFLPQVLEPLLKLSPSLQQPLGQDSLLEQELLWELDGLGESARQSMQGAIAQLQQIFQSEYEAIFPNCQQEILANLLNLQATLNRLYTSSLAQNAPFQDLLLLFVAVYCSEDSYSNFWAVDDAIAAFLIPCWNYLRQQSVD